MTINVSVTLKNEDDDVNDEEHGLSPSTASTLPGRDTWMEPRAMK